MHYTTLTVSFTKNLGNYSSQKVEVQAVVEPSDDIADCYDVIAEAMAEMPEKPVLPRVAQQEIPFE